MQIVARALRDPNPSPETEAFWSATAQGVFLVRRCRACGKAHWYPRTVCPFCSGLGTDWVPGSGLGVIYSFSVMRRAEPPFVMAYVTLAEGPTMMTNIVNCDPATLEVGAAVEVIFVRSEGGFAVPCFQPKPGSLPASP
jgi:uncharacterized OB-fold protein